MDDLKAGNNLDFKTVNTQSLEGLKLAEKLLKEGWKIYSQGFWNIYFSREKKKK